MGARSIPSNQIGSNQSIFWSHLTDTRIISNPNQFHLSDWLIPSNMRSFQSIPETWRSNGQFDSLLHDSNSLSTFLNGVHSSSIDPFIRSIHAISPDNDSIHDDSNRRWFHPINASIWSMNPVARCCKIDFIQSYPSDRCSSDRFQRHDALTIKSIL